LKLVTYIYQETARLGAIIDGNVVDLAQAYADCLSCINPDAPPDEFPKDMLTLLQGGWDTWQTLVATVEYAESLSEADFIYAMPDVQLGPPLDNPSKIVCVGLNYHDHAREQGVEVPPRPLLFDKFSTAIIGPDDEISWPAEVSQQVDYEAELAVVIGRSGRNIPADEVYDYIAGYTIVNDVSARDAQYSDKQWVRGKSFDTFCPMGPYLLTADEVEEPHNLGIRCWVNGELRQDSNTFEMIFKIPELLSYISRTSTLLPGDIISTGTPDGVGVFRDPKVFLKPGDVIEIEIDKLGRLRNTVS
jgi:2-keto-4-pentenoate hydratase/2-oxohepta-3-ene-1,7-dioic acid hydratase in catechol pathway